MRECIECPFMLASTAEKPISGLKPTHDTFGSHERHVITVRTRLLASHHGHRVVVAHWLLRTNADDSYEITTTAHSRIARGASGKLQPASRSQLLSTERV